MIGATQPETAAPGRRRLGTTAGSRGDGAGQGDREQGNDGEGEDEDDHARSLGPF